MNKEFGIQLEGQETLMRNGEEQYACTFSAILDKEQLYAVLAASRLHETLVTIKD